MDVEKYNNSINNLNELMKAGILTESEVQEKKSLLEEMMNKNEDESDTKVLLQPKPNISDYNTKEVSKYEAVENKNSIFRSKWFWIVTIAIVVLAYPYVSKTIKDGKALEESELLGEWRSNTSVDFYINSDGTFTTSEQYISGKWEVTNSKENTIRIWYTISDDQVNAYNNEHKYDFDENEVVYLTPEEIMDIVLYEGDGPFPEEGEYNFVRSEQKLYYVDDSDDTCFLYR